MTADPILLFKAYKRVLARRDKPTKARRKVKRTRYPNICEQAKALGVHRVHLYMVLSGRRESRRLMARYHDLTRSVS